MSEIEKWDPKTRTWIVPYRTNDTVDQYYTGPLAHGRQSPIYLGATPRRKNLRFLIVICTTLVVVAVIVAWTIKSIVVSNNKAAVDKVKYANATYRQGWADGTLATHGIFVFLVFVFIGFVLWSLSKKGGK